MPNNNLFSNHAGIQQLLSILSVSPSTAACEACLDGLEAYVTAQLNSDPQTEALAKTAVHLDSCPQCAQVYALLYEAMLAEASDPHKQPIPVPAPDLSFLRQHAPSLAERIKQALQPRIDGVLLQLDAALLALLQSSLPPTAVSTARSGDDRYTQKLIDIPQDILAEDPLPFALVAYEDSQNANACLLEVKVQPPGKSWPHLAGSTVSLITPDKTESAQTDSWGTAVFANVPRQQLDSLQLDIRFAH